MKLMSYKKKTKLYEADLILQSCNQSAERDLRSGLFNPIIVIYRL